MSIGLSLTIDLVMILLRGTIGSWYSWLVNRCVDKIGTKQKNEVVGKKHSIVEWKWKGSNQPARELTI
jgi:hypothetical protein